MSDIEISRIFLCGFMGTGKTTLGKILARSTGKPFIDLDELIVKRARLAIPKIFHLYGEAHFRTLEKRALNEVISKGAGVIALGGGALQDNDMLQTIKSNGLLVFIETPFDELLSRLTRNKNRPMLLDNEGRMKDKETLKQDLSNLYYKRLPFYKEAHISFSTSKDLKPAEQVALLKERICEYEQTA